MNSSVKVPAFYAFFWFYYGAQVIGGDGRVLYHEHYCQNCRNLYITDVESNYFCHEQDEMSPFHLLMIGRRVPRFFTRYPATFDVNCWEVQQWNSSD